MKNYLSFFLISLLLFACGTSKKTSRILPDTVDQKIYFGMPLDEFKKLKADKVESVDDGMPFRHVFIEDIEHPELTNLGYYFDADNDKPLYEVLLIYKDEETMQRNAAEILGPPNYKETEWKIERENAPDMLAWTFKSKIIIVSLISGTEWHEDAAEGEVEKAYDTQNEK